MLKAFVDDSIESHKVLILAGLISSPTRWVEFSNEWRACSIAAGWKNGVFKMRDAMGMAKRDTTKLEHIKRHYDILKRHTEFGISFALPLEPFKRIAKQFPLIGGNLSRDYYWAIRGIIMHLAEYQPGTPLRGQIDFIFDKMTVARQIHDAWEFYEKTASPSQLALTGRKPVFEDDEKTLPLQGADMWAWFCRKSWLDGSYMKENAFPIPWGSINDFGVMMMQYEERELIRQFTAACDRFADDQGVPKSSLALMIETKT